MEWEKQEQHHHHHHQHHQHHHQQQQPQQAKETQHQQQQQQGEGIASGTAGGNGVLYVKVMTDEQLETLRKQIAVYASICEQLVEMHKNLTAQQDLAGVRLGNLYCDPLMTTAGHKITARQRWTPTATQLHILERIFNEGTGTPTKQKIKEITTELSQHGQISETNVYNWFQNRRARSKRKQQNAAGSNAESEAEAEVESPKEMKTKPEIFQSQQNPVSRNEDLCFQSPEISSDLHFADSQTKVESMFSSDGSLRPRNRNLGQLAFYDAVLSNPGNEHLGGKMEVPGAYSLYHPVEDFDMSG